MKEQLISFETAKLAYEKGFDEPVSNSYFTPDEGKTHALHTWDLNCSNSDYISTRYSAPTQSLLQKWLRETFGIMISFGTNDFKFRTFVYYLGVNYYNAEDGPEFESENYNTYEEALEQALYEALKLI